MSQKRFFLDKATQTFADTLAVFGVATILEEISNRTTTNNSIRISDQGGYYEIACTPGLEDEWLEHATETPIIPIPFIRTRKNHDKLPDDLIPGSVIDYEQVRDRRNEYWEAWKGLSKEGQRAALQATDHPETLGLPNPPHPDWDIFRAINPSGLIGYNNLVQQWWLGRNEAASLLRILTQMMSRIPNDVAGAEDAWKGLAKEKSLVGNTQATSGQLYNPAQGKGQNRAKADNLSMGNVKDFWLLEYLKAVGLYQAGFTRQLRGSKDRKTYVVAPHAISLRAHRAIMRDFRKRMPFGEAATRSDILTVLRFTQAFLEYCQQDQGRDLMAQLLGGHTPQDSISGFHVAYYKNLGNSAATMNLAFLNTPGWVFVQTSEDIANYLAVLDEHETIIRSINESHSNAYELLLDYRDFIASDNLDPFFEFTTAYSTYLISQRERGRFALPLNLDNLRRLIVSAEPNYSVILNPERHPGFQNIAYAIRQSTVVAQYRKQQGDRRYDVRYGLGQDLARKARYPNEFITALSDFLHKYNAENAQVMETRPGPYRRSIKTNDIADIIELIDEFGCELICNLLVAFGYARTSRSADNVQAESSDDSGDGPEEDEDADLE